MIFYKKTPHWPSGEEALTRWGCQRKSCQTKYKMLELLPDSLQSRLGGLAEKIIWVFRSEREYLNFCNGKKDLKNCKTK